MKIAAVFMNNMLIAYIDDSHTIDSAFVLAGYIAPAEKWAAFSAEWQSILDMWKPPLNPFKMNVAHNSWSDEIWRERLLLFYRAIENHVSAGLSLVIPYKEYRRVFAGKLYASNPYNIAFFQIIGKLATYQNQLGLTEPVDFVFDKGNEERVTMGWDRFVAKAPEKYRNLLGKKPTFGDDKTILPLQAADLLAWIRRRKYETQQNRALVTRKMPWPEKSNLLYLEMEWTEQGIREAFNALYGDEERT